MKNQPVIQRAEYNIGGGVARNINRGLSDREWQVMLAISKGETPSSMAKRLGLSTKTVLIFRAWFLDILLVIL